MERYNHYIFLIVATLFFILIAIAFHIIPAKIQLINSEVEKISCKTNRDAAIKAFYENPVMHRNLDADGDNKPCE